MKLFNRKADSFDHVPAMPPELNDYYQAEKRQQTVVTWLLGFATLAITVALALGLFLGTRWLVNKIRHEPTKKPVATQPESQPAAPAPATTAPQSGTTQTPTPTTASNQSPQTSSATTNLPNTGPADTLAVFLVATMVGTFAYQVKSRR